MILNSLLLNFTPSYFDCYRTLLKYEILLKAHPICGLYTHETTLQVVLSYKTLPKVQSRLYQA